MAQLRIEWIVQQFSMEAKTIMMNAMNNVEDVPKKGGKSSGEGPTSHQSPMLAVLSMIQIALAADFARFENLNNAKTLLESLRSQANLQPQTQTRSASLPSHRNFKLVAPQSSKKSTQKSQSSKPAPPTRPLVPKTAESKTPLPQGTNKPKKTAWSESTTKTVCCKGKKKIHKNQDVKRDNPKRVIEPCLMSTAQIPRMRLGEKEKRRIRRLLLQREMPSWTHPQDLRREGRELRNQH